VDSLERYVMNITEPFDFTETPVRVTEVIIELMEEGDDTPKVWTPKLPEHALGNQHMNVGLDFFSAENAYSTAFTDAYHYIIVRTGVKMELPYGHHMMIGSRSGMGFNKHIQAFPGIIDHSYRGEIKIKLHSPAPFEILAGDKIAQGLIFRSQDYMLSVGTVDTNTERGEKGFGSTDSEA